MMQAEGIQKRPLQRLAKRLGAALEQHPVQFIIVLAFAVTLVVEMVSRHSPWQGIGFLFTHPVHFVSNMTIVLVTFAIGLFFQKRAFFLAVLAAFWLGLGITNAIVLAFRTTPFGAIDIELLPSVATSIPVYLEIWQIVVITIALVLTLAVLVLTFIMSPKYAPSYRIALL